MNVSRKLVLLSLALPALGLSIASLVAQTPKPAVTPPAKQGSAVFKWEGFTPKPTAVGVRRDVTDLPTATLEKFESHISTLNPGKMSHPPHKHAQEEFIVLKEGTLDVFINGQVTRVGAGSLLFFASNDLHNVTNVGDTPATYLVFNVTTAATHAAPAQGATAAAAPGKLVSRVFDWSKLDAKETKTGARREVVNSPTTTLASFECHVTTLKPGEAPHAPHHHPDEELVVVKEGLMEATINGVAQRGGPGSIFFYGSNDEHGMKNVGTTPATYHVFRFITEATPKPPAPAAIRIKTGIDAPLKDADGNVWQPDQGFLDGDTIARPELAIANTKSPDLYRAERYSMTAFSRAVPNGKYTVKLHFAETYEGIEGPGQRVFSFNVEGKEFKDFDVWVKAGGPRIAYIETVEVEVKDGKLDITFTPKIENPEINALEIIPAP